MPRKTWVYDPHSGGRAIPKASQAKIRQRILAHASRHYAGKYKQVEVRFPGTSVTSTPTRSLLLQRTTTRNGTGNRERSTSNGCGIRRFASAGCVTLGTRTAGRWLSIPTAMKNTSRVRLAMAAERTPEEAFDISAVYLIE